MKRPYSTPIFMIMVIGVASLTTVITNLLFYLIDKHLG
jgi:hypothetical protein